MGALAPGVRFHGPLPPRQAERRRGYGVPPAPQPVARTCGHHAVGLRSSRRHARCECGCRLVFHSSAVAATAATAIASLVGARARCCTFRATACCDSGFRASGFPVIARVAGSYTDMVPRALGRRPTCRPLVCATGGLPRRWLKALAASFALVGPVLYFTPNGAPPTRLATPLAALHDSPLAGHVGHQRTLDLVQQRFY